MSFNLQIPLPSLLFFPWDFFVESCSFSRLSQIGISLIVFHGVISVNWWQDLEKLDQIQVQFFFLREYFSFWSPGDSVVMGQPANAGHTGLIPGQGRSHMPWNWARVPQLLNLSSSARVLQQEALLQWEVWASQQKSSPCSPQLEKSLCGNKDPAKLKINK